LTAIVVLILILSHSLEKFGQMQRLLSAFKGLLSNVKLNLVMFPALIGLLPMPGGAVFSAPMVEAMGKDHNLSPETKSLINYWFRHVWEFSWPLYPGPLLAASLASISIWWFVGLSFPLTLTAIIAGDLFFLHHLSGHLTPSQSASQASQARSFFKETIPIFLVVAGAITGNIIIGAFQSHSRLLANMPQELPLVLSLVISILWVWLDHHASRADITAIFKHKSLLNMIYMVMAIYGFKGILEDSHAIIDVSTFLAEQRIPLVLVCMVLPALVGLISGISVAFVGSTFPILISLMQTLHVEGSHMLPYLILSFSAGFMGVMCSPLHVCLIFTREYFQADLPKLYRQLWKPVVLLLSVAFIYFIALRLLGF
jgi:integral membrane protein (TIGR00529 family)